MQISSYDIRMKVTFNDLFNHMDDHQLQSKKNIRIGALVIPENHVFDPHDPQLGIPINQWESKTFDVDITDTNTVIIKRINNE